MIVVHDTLTRIHSEFFCWWDSYTDARLARLSYCFKYKRGIKKNEKKNDVLYDDGKIPQGADDNGAANHSSTMMQIDNRESPSCIIL